MYVVLQLLGGDSFGDPTELLPYLGPGGGSGSTVHVQSGDSLMTDSGGTKMATERAEDLMALFS